MQCKNLEIFFITTWIKLKKISVKKLTVSISVAGTIIGEPYNTSKLSNKVLFLLTSSTDWNLLRRGKTIEAHRRHDSQIGAELNSNINVNYVG